MFTYKARDMQGHLKIDIIEALNEGAVIDKLQGQGLIVIEVSATLEKMRKETTKKLAQPIKFSHNAVNLEDLLVFSRQLATMLEAGVTLLRAFNVIIPQVQGRQLYHTLEQVQEDIQSGKSLSQSLVKHPKVFNRFWVSLAEVGEASGTMPRVLTKLANHMEEQAAFRSLIISALIYPAILFCACIGAVIFFALVVAPRFEDIFNSMHAQLPVMTKILLSTFKFIKQNLLILFAAAGGLFYGLKSYLKTRSGALVGEQILFGLPLLGNVIKLIVVERFTSQMAILVDSGVPLLLSLEISERLVENQTYGLLMAEIREQVREGKSLGDSMDKSQAFPSMAVQMIKVGEETGELSKMLGHIAAYYKSNVEAFMKRLGIIIEPFMLVFMATVIGTVVISIFLPLFKLGQGAGIH